jgi:hypothetical protein
LTRPSRPSGMGSDARPSSTATLRVWRTAGITAVFVAILVWAVGSGDLTGRTGDLSTGGLLAVLGWAWPPGFHLLGDGRWHRPCHLGESRRARRREGHCGPNLRGADKPGFPGSSHPRVRPARSSAWCSWAPRLDACLSRRVPDGRSRPGHAADGVRLTEVSPRVADGRRRLRPSWAIDWDSPATSRPEELPGQEQRSLGATFFLLCGFTQGRASTRVLH